MEHPRYQVGIDLGTTYTAAAVCRDGGGADARPETVALATAGAAVPSVVFLAPDGTLLVGEPAQRRALSEPGRVVREFKRRVGDETPLVVGGESVPADAISARFVAWVVAEVARREGGPASRIAVTHPVEWGEHKRGTFAAALAAEGVADALFLTEPQAAAVGYPGADRVADGAAVAVYDLGGGTFDAAVVRKQADGSFALLGRPAGIERLGGVDFDDAIFAHVRDAVGEAWDALDPEDPAVQTAVAGLRRECTAAKETLSADTEVMIPVLLPGLHTMVRLGRAEFEDMIRPSVVETVEALRRALALAEVDPAALDAVLLVGGSSRIPLVSQLVSAELGRPISVDSDPKTVVAAGAALAARGPRPAVAADPLGLDDPGFDDAPTEILAVVGAAAEPSGRRRHALLATAVVGVAAAFALSATAVAGFGPFTPRTVAEQSAAPAAVAAAPAAVDPWTGTPIEQENPTGTGGDTAATVTTLAGPHRPAAVAAAVRPLARIVSTGAGGAARTVAVPGAVVRQAGSTSVLPEQRSTTTTGGAGDGATGTKDSGSAKPDPKPSPAPKPDAEPSPAPKPDPKPDPQPDPQPQPEPQPDPQPQPEPQPDPKLTPQPDPEPAPQPEPKPDPKPDPQPDPAGGGSNTSDSGGGAQPATGG